MSISSEDPLDMDRIPPRHKQVDDEEDTVVEIIVTAEQYVSLFVCFLISCSSFLPFPANPVPFLITSLLNTHTHNTPNRIRNLDLGKLISSERFQGTTGSGDKGRYGVNSGETRDYESDEDADETSAHVQKELHELYGMSEDMTPAAGSKALLRKGLKKRPVSSSRLSSSMYSDRKNEEGRRGGSRRLQPPTRVRISLELAYEEADLQPWTWEQIIHSGNGKKRNKMGARFDLEEDEEDEEGEGEEEEEQKESESHRLIPPIIPLLSLPSNSIRFSLTVGEFRRLCEQSSTQLTIKLYLLFGSSSQSFMYVFIFGISNVSHPLPLSPSFLSLSPSLFFLSLSIYLSSNNPPHLSHSPSYLLTTSPYRDTSPTAVAHVDLSGLRREAFDHEGWYHLLPSTMSRERFNTSLQSNAFTFDDSGQLQDVFSEHSAHSMGQVSVRVSTEPTLHSLFPRTSSISPHTNLNMSGNVSLSGIGDTSDIIERRGESTVDNEDVEEWDETRWLLRDVNTTVDLLRHVQDLSLTSSPSSPPRNKRSASGNQTDKSVTFQLPVEFTEYRETKSKPLNYEEDFSFAELPSSVRDMSLRDEEAVEEEGMDEAKERYETGGKGGFEGILYSPSSPVPLAFDTTQHLLEHARALPLSPRLNDTDHFKTPTLNARSNENNRTYKSERDSWAVVFDYLEDMCTEDSVLLDTSSSRTPNYPHSNPPPHQTRANRRSTAALHSASPSSPVCPTCHHPVESPSRARSAESSFMSEIDVLCADLDKLSKNLRRRLHD